MLAIVIEEGFQPGFSRDELESLADLLRGKVADCDVEIEWNKHDQVLYDLPMLTIETINAHVPWEAITGAAATVVLESIRDWLASRYRDRQAKHDAERAAAQQEAEEPYPLGPWPVLPQEVRILGPKGQLLGVVYAGADIDEPTFVTGDDGSDNDAMMLRQR